MKVLMLLIVLLFCGAAAAGTACPDPSADAENPATNGDTKIAVLKKNDGCPTLADTLQANQKHKKQHKVMWYCKDGCKNGDKLDIRFQPEVVPAPACQNQRCQWKPDPAQTYASPLSYVICINGKCTDPRIIIEDI